MQLLRAHDAIVRSALAANDGREVKHTGDGIMASFGSVAAAARCATAIQLELALRNRNAELAVTVRFGMSAGEPVAEGEDLFGSAVQLAARLYATNEPGSVVVSGAVRDLCAGNGFRFRELDLSELKGFPEPVDSYALLCPDA